MNSLFTPAEIAEKGDSIYNELFRDKYEGIHDGKFIAINVVNSNGFLGDYPEEALADAQAKEPTGTFYLAKIGANTAFHVGYLGERDDELDWAIRRTA